MDNSEVGDRSEERQREGRRAIILRERREGEE